MSQQLRFAKFLVLLNGAVPVTLLGYDALRGQLGANPVNFAIRTTGMLALVFLILTLAVTPLAKTTGPAWLTNVRRTLGLYAFFHAALHFLLFFGFDRNLSVSSTLSEMVVRPYLSVGAASLLIMVPLAVTSTNAMIRRIGSPRWKKLHRLTYLAAIAGVAHYYMLVKADVRQPVAFGIVLAILLGYRLGAFLSQRAAKSSAPDRRAATARVPQAARNRPSQDAAVPAGGSRSPSLAAPKAVPEVTADPSADGTQPGSKL